MAGRLRRANRARRANAWRNARGTPERTARWAPARDALWDVLAAWTPEGASVAVVGAGNGDSVPLGRLAARAGRVDLIDVDAAAAGRARERTGGAARVLPEDVSGGAADRIVQAVRRGRDARDPLAPGGPIGKPPYDVVVADLVLSQVLYPALLDRGLEQDAIGAALRRYGDPLTASIVDRLHAAAPGGVVVHVHDPAGWWDGHPQPVALGEILAAPDVDSALALVERCTRPTGCDPRIAEAAAGAEICATALWRWPFQDGVDYLVCATVARRSRSR